PPAGKGRDTFPDSAHWWRLCARGEHGPPARPGDRPARGGANRRGLSLGTGALISFQNRNRSSVLLSMAEADKNHPGISGFKQLFTWLVQNHKWLAAFFAANFHVLPSELGADAGSKGFRDGFLGGKTRRQEG